MLDADIDLAGIAWTPIGNVTSYPGVSFGGTFDGQNHTISNMTTNDSLPNYAAAGLFGSTFGTIKNVTVDKAKITSTHYAGGIVAYTSNDAHIIDCKVTNSEITSTPELIGGAYDNGDKVGGIMGYVTAGASVTGCEVNGCTITAYRDLGGVVGCSASANVTGNKVTSTTVKQCNTNAYSTGTITTVGEVIGRLNGGVTVDASNTATNVTIVNESAPAVEVPTVTKDEANGITEQIANAINANTAVKAPEATNVAQVDGVEKLVIKAESVTDGKVMFDVTPQNAQGEKVENPAQPITFRLPYVGSSDKVKLYHESDFIGYAEVKGAEGSKYVEVTSGTFSNFGYEDLPAGTVAAIGETPYTTLAAAFEAAQNGETVELLAASFGDDESAAIAKLNGENVKVIGVGDTKPEIKVTFDGGGKHLTGSSTVTFENIAFTFTHKNYGSMPYTQSLSANYKNCTINGMIAVVYNTSTFDNCVFTGTDMEYALWQYAGNLVVKNCHFTGTGKKAPIKMYGEANNTLNCTLENNKFDAVGSYNAAVYVTNENNKDDGTKNCGGTAVYSFSTDDKNTVPEGKSVKNINDTVGFVAVDPTFDESGKIVTATFVGGGGVPEEKKTKVLEAAISEEAELKTDEHGNYIAEEAEPAAPNFFEDEAGVWHVANEAGWALFAAMVNDGNDFSDEKVVLDADLDFSTEANAEYFVPVGEYGWDDEAGEDTSLVFNGKFDGNENTVTLAATVEEDGYDVALFAYVGENGTVKNLTTEGTVTGAAGASYFAAICANNYGTLENCVNTADVSGLSEYDEESDIYSAAHTFGGICAYNEGTIENCTNTGAVTGAAGCSNFGGVCGDNYGVIKILVSDKLVAVYTDKALDTDATVELVGEELAPDIDNWCNISGVELSDTGLAAIIAEAIENSTTVADADELDALVRVKVTPTVFDSDADAGFAEIQYTLEPVAYVYANEGYFDFEYETYVNEYDPDAEIAITDELKEQPISLTFYTGFMPETVKVGSETFTGNAIEWQWWPPIGIYIDSYPFCTVTTNLLGTVVASMGTRPVAEVKVGTTTTKYGTVDAAFAAAAAVESGSVTITVYNAAELDSKNYEFKCDTTINGDLNLKGSSIKAPKLVLDGNIKMTVDSSIESTVSMEINVYSYKALLVDVTGATEEEYKLIKHGGNYSGVRMSIDADTNTDEKYVADNFGGTADGVKLNPDIYEPVAKVEYFGSTPDKEFVDLHEAFSTDTANIEKVTLLKDVDLSDVEWTPVAGFKGTFDAGINNKISNLTISGTGDNVGMFATLEGATVMNLSIVGATVESTGSYVGVLAGKANNCGISVVEISDADVSGVKRVGGLIGQVTGTANIAGCTIAGSVTGSDSNTGGLIGEIAGGTAELEGLHNNANVTNTENGTSRAAGIVGQITSEANVTLTNCGNNASITANDYAGGIVAAKQGGSSVKFVECMNTNNATLSAPHTGTMLAWTCNGGKVEMEDCGEVEGAIGFVSEDNYFNLFVIDDVEYLYRTPTSGTGVEFNDLWSGRKVLNKAYMDRIIAFYTYAKEKNDNFAAYPSTYTELFAKAWNSKTGKISNLFNTDTASGWPLLLSQYNTAKSDDMTADDFAVTWDEGILYSVAEAVASVTKDSKVTYYADLHEALVAGKDAGRVVTLLKDVDLTGIEWAPVGAGTRSGKTYSGDPFKGTFDGDNHTITGLQITKTEGADYSLGLIGILDGGTVKNLTLDNVDINNSTSEMAGAAVGMMVNGATVENVTVNGSIEVARGVGGIVGRMTVEGTIKDCVNNATISGTGANVAGIVGAAYYNASGKTMTITNCANKGTVTGTAGGVGGIAGLSCADVSGCTNTAAITAKGASVGGIIGEQQNAGSVKNCENSGKVTNSSNTYGTGGIIGWVRYSGGDAEYPVKAIIEVSGNSNSGSVESNGNGAGGIVGIVYNQASVTGNTNTAYSIKAGLWAAGIVGGYQANMGSNTVIGDGKLVITGNRTTTIPDADHMSMNQYSPVVYDNTQKIDWSDNTYPVAKTITDNGALVSVFYNNDIMTELASLGDKHIVELLWNVDGTYTLADEDEVLRVKHNSKTLTVEAPTGYEVKTEVNGNVTTYTAEMVPVAQIGETKYETLDAAFAALPTAVEANSTAVLELLDETAWVATTPVYYNGHFYANLSTAVAAVTGENISVFCRPDTTLTDAAHNVHFDCSVTIYGNGATAGDTEPDLGSYFNYDNTKGKRTITMYSLNKAGIWGNIDDNAEIDINVINCTNVHEILVQQGKGATVNTTVKNCTFDKANGTGSTGISQECGGTLTVEKCSFKGLTCGMNVKNDYGSLTTNVKGCTFEDCGSNSETDSYAAALRFGSKTGATQSVTIDGATVSFTDGKSAKSSEIMIGENRAANDGAGLTSYSISNVSNAKLDVYPQHAGNANVPVSKDAEKSVALTGETVENDNKALIPDAQGIYHITNLTDLNTFRSMVNGGNTFDRKTVELDADITFTGDAWDSGIGVPGKKFNGTFDGKGKTITNLAVSTNNGYAGLFGTVHGATIKDLSLVNPVVSTTGTDYAAALVAHGYAKIDNCTVTGGSVTGVEQVGGFVGYLSCGHVKNSTISGTTITANTDRVGGIAGKANVDSQYVISGNTVSEVTVKGADSAALVGQVMTGSDKTWQITDNKILNVTVQDANGTSAFNPIGNFRSGSFQSDAVIGGHIVRNHWEPATTPDSYDMVNPSKLEEKVTIENYYAVKNTTKNKGYSTLEAAVADAASGDTLTMNADLSGNGIQINKSIIIDLNNKTYTVCGPTLAGSQGTQTQGFQLLVNNNVTFENGTINTTAEAGAKMLIQNYSNLTLKNVELDGSNLTGTKYTLSNNAGNIVLGGTTKIIAAENGVAYDLYDWASGSAAYTGVSMTIGENVTITGKTEVGGDRETLNIQVSAPTALMPTAPEGYVWDSTGKLGKAVAKIGDVLYPTLADAVAAAQSGETVTLLDNCSGSGIKIDKNVTIDFGGKTYTVGKPGVGSTNYETSGFQILQGNSVEFKNGKIDIATGNPNQFNDESGKPIKMLIQNYANLTLTGMTLDATNINRKNNAGAAYTGARYAMSNNSGSVVIEDTTITVASGDVAFDTCKSGTYAVPTVEVKGTSVINGNVELSGGDLTLTAGTLNGKLVDGGIGTSNVTKATGFTAEAPEGYVWDKDGKLGKPVAQIGTTKYATLADAIAHVKDNETIELIADITSGGMTIDTKKTFTVDFKNHTLTFDGYGAGSTGTTTQGFQIKVGQNVTFKNGTINCSEANAAMTWDTSLSNTKKGIAWIINNYATLNLDNMKIDGTNVAHNGNTVRNVVNNYAGTVNVTNGSVITATGSDFAINAYYYNAFYTPNAAYNAPVTTVTGSTVTGKVEAISGTVNLESGTTVNGQVRVGENKDGTKSGSTVNVNSGSTVNGVVAVFGGGSTLNIAGTVKGYIATNGNSYNKDCTVNINAGAAITATGDGVDVPVYIPNGTLNVTGGTITGETAVYVKAGTLNISGGELKATGAEQEYQFSSNGCRATGDALVIDNCNYPSALETVTISGGTFTSDHGKQIGYYEYGEVELADVTCTAENVLAPAGYKWDRISNKLTKVEKVARIGENTYPTLAAAIEVVGDGETITMIADVQAAGGISVPSCKNFTVDFNNHSYTVEKPGAGSANTKTQAFQLLQGSTITFKNGTIGCTTANANYTWVSSDNIKGVALVIQNYANLTLENMTIDGTNIAHNGNNVRYVLSNNSGNVVIDNTTITTAEGDFAFDTCKYGEYALPSVEVKGTSAITGKVSLDGGNLALNSGTLTGELVATENVGEGVVTKANGFTADAPANYKWDDTGTLVPIVNTASEAVIPNEKETNAFATASTYSFEGNAELKKAIADSIQSELRDNEAVEAEGATNIGTAITDDVVTQLIQGKTHTGTPAEQIKIEVEHGTISSSASLTSGVTKDNTSVKKLRFEVKPVIVLQTTDENGKAKVEYVTIPNDKIPTGGLSFRLPVPSTMVGDSITANHYQSDGTTLIESIQCAVQGEAPNLYVELSGIKSFSPFELVAPETKVTSITVSGPGTVYTEKNVGEQMTATINPDAADKGVVWGVENVSSYDTKPLAEITNDGVVKATGEGNGYVRVTATATDGSNVSGTMQVEIKVSVEKISIDVATGTESAPEEITLASGTASYSFTATEKPSTAYVHGISWSVVDGETLATATAASASDYGFTATEPGFYKVIGTADDGKGAEIVLWIEVKEILATAIEITKDNAEVTETLHVELGQTLSLGTAFTPTNTSYNTSSDVTWSNNSTHGSVYNGLYLAGSDFEDAQKTDTITVKWDRDETVSDSVSVFIDPVPYTNANHTSVETAKAIKVRTGGSYNVDLSDFLTAENGKTPTAKITDIAIVGTSSDAVSVSKDTNSISCSDTTTAAVTVKVTAQCFASVDDAAETKEFYYKVTAAQPDKVEISGGTQVAVNGTLDLTAVAKFETGDGDLLAPGAEITWSSSDENKATVDQNGKVTGKVAGDVIITATLAANKNVKATHGVTVIQKSVSISGDSAVKVYKSITLTATANPDGETVMWKSSDESIATVDVNGNVTGVSDGEVTITAYLYGLDNVVFAEQKITVSRSVIVITSGEGVDVGSDLALTAEVDGQTSTDVTWSIVPGDTYASLAGSTLTGTAAGKVTVQATYTGDTTVTATKEITVSAVVSGAVARNTTTGETYPSLTAALAAATSGQTVEPLKDIGTGAENAAPAEPYILVTDGITLNLNGFDIVNATLFYVTGNVKDKFGSASEKGYIKAQSYVFAASQITDEFPIGNEGFMPVYDNSVDGYRLIKLRVNEGASGVAYTTNEHVMTFVVANTTERAVAYALFNSDYTSFHKHFKAYVTVTWTENAGTDKEVKVTQDYEYGDKFMENMASKKQSLQVKIGGYSGTVTVQPKFVCLDSKDIVLATIKGTAVDMDLS